MNVAKNESGDMLVFSQNDWMFHAFRHCCFTEPSTPSQEPFFQHWIKFVNVAAFLDSRCSPFQNSYFIIQLVQLTVSNDCTFAGFKIFMGRGLTSQCGSESLHLFFHFVLLLSYVKSTAGHRSLYFFSLLTQQLSHL